MSSQPNDPGGRAVATERRRAVASFRTYAEAERAVDYLADRKFPVEHVTIVGEGLRFVEQVTGRLNWLQALLRGAASGALVGLLVGWLFGVFNWFNPVVSSFWLAIDGLWFGAVVGALFGLLMYALTGGRRDFTSVGALRAERYELVVDEGYGDEAARLLAEFGGRAEAAPTAGAAADREIEQTPRTPGAPGAAGTPDQPASPRRP
jgi:hypothetical protein